MCIKPQLNSWESYHSDCYTVSNTPALDMIYSIVDYMETVFLPESHEADIFVPLA